MPYPNCMDLENVVVSIHNDPTFVTRNMLGYHPLLRFSEIDEGIRLILDDELGDFLKPPEGKVHFFNRFERLPRLADGTYKVLVPGFEGSFLDRQVKVEDIVLELEHKRTHHQCASFEPKRYDANELPLHVLEYSSENMGEVARLVNLEIIGTEISSVYSEFRARLDLPEDWEKNSAGFEKYYKEHFIPYNEAKAELFQEMMADGKILQQIKREMDKKDSEFLAEHKKTIQDAVVQSNILFIQYYMALSKLLDQYSLMVRGRPMFHRVKKNTSISIDHTGRVIGHRNLGVCRPLYIADINYSPHITERFPFNEKFHSKFKEKLTQVPRKGEEYEGRSFEVLRDAYSLLDDYRMSEAVTRACTAFEIVLKGFLVKNNAITKEEADRGEYSIGQMMDFLFKRAAQNQTPQERRCSFEPRIKDRILRRQDDRVESIQQFRNNIAHGNQHSDVDYYKAAIAVRTYTEAIQYIIDQGWKNRGSLNLGSDILLWSAPHLNGSIPSVPDNTVVDELKRSLKTVMEYMDPRELAIYRRSVPKYSWAHNILKA